jgi:creatinine amidohydrolase
LRAPDLRKMIIVTSHGGNVAPMEIVARELRQTHAMAVATTSWTRLTMRVSTSYPEGPMVDIHGGLSETSMMLALYPELVRTDLVEDFASAQTPLRQGSAKLGFHMADANLGWLSQDLNPKGPVGDASSATAALGAADIESQVEGFVALIDDMARHSPPEPPDWVILVPVGCENRTFTHSFGRNFSRKRSSDFHNCDLSPDRQRL